jgi:Ca-activated chloride channel family protein
MGLTHFSTFHFLHPLWLLLLPPLLGLAIRFTRSAAGHDNWARVMDLHLLQMLRIGTPERGRSRWWLIGALWSLVVLALAGPAWMRVPTAGYRNPAGWVIAVDLSPSMASTDVTPDRATRARYAAADLLSAAHGARVGLIAFAGESYTVSPLTDDMATVGSLLEPLSPHLMPESGDRLVPALIDARQLLHGSAVSRGEIIVLSDGIVDPAAAIDEAERLHRDGMTVNVVAIGKIEGDELERIASAGGGRYVSMHDLPYLINALTASAEHLDEPTVMSHAQVTQWRNEGILLLPMILIVGALIARRGWV